jgi:hypothetical protein
MAKRPLRQRLTVQVAVDGIFTFETPAQLLSIVQSTFNRNEIGEGLFGAVQLLGSMCRMASAGSSSSGVLIRFAVFYIRNLAQSLLFKCYRGLAVGEHFVDEIDLRS